MSNQPPGKKPEVPPSIPPHIAARGPIDLTSNPALVAPRLAPPAAVVPLAPAKPTELLMSSRKRAAATPVSIAVLRATKAPVESNARQLKPKKIGGGLAKAKAIAAEPKPVVTVDSLLVRNDELAAEVDALKTLLRQHGIQVPGTRTELVQREPRSIDMDNPCRGLTASEIKEIGGRLYPDQPPTHPSLGDLTPSYVAWIQENHPEDAAVRYDGRADSVARAYAWAAANGVE